MSNGKSVKHFLKSHILRETILHQQRVEAPGSIFLD